MRKNIRFVLFTIALMLVTGCSMGGVAMCQPRDHVYVNEQRYIELESEYIKEVRTLLDEAGLIHAGVMLTHVREEDGTRIYKLQVHHKSYSFLKNEERENLFKALEECGFEPDTCVFVLSFTA
ncbi:MAG: hypothetical protein Q4C58_00980 [Eubacteriales bacterium]|nr:hypothetical protein [Eubacteriales bacterium]